MLQNREEALVIEAGVKPSEVRKACGFDAMKIKAVIVSHRHNDHAGYAADFGKAGITVLAPQDVIDAKGIEEGIPIKPKTGYTFGGFHVLPFEVCHDVPCVGYLIEHDETGRILFFTDTYAMPYTVPDVNHFMIEANYADDILSANILSGKVPQALRKRLMTSHMSIDNAIGILRRHDLSTTQDILLIHLSDGNSDEKRFVKAVKAATGKNVMAAAPGMEIDYSNISSI